MSHIIFQYFRGCRLPPAAMADDAVPQAEGGGGRSLQLVPHQDASSYREDIRDIEVPLPVSSVSRVGVWELNLF